jgi:hypothetical protein
LSNRLLATTKAAKSTKLRVLRDLRGCFLYGFLAALCGSVSHESVSPIPPRHPPLVVPSKKITAVAQKTPLTNTTPYTILMIITGAHSRATPFFDNSTAVGAAFPRQLHGINLHYGASGLAFFAPRRLCGSTALRNSRKIARIQMRNGRQQPFHRQRPKTLARSDLQQLCPSPPSRPLRKIRDLIIFAKIMRKCAITRPTCSAPAFCIKTPK